MNEINEETSAEVEEVEAEEVLEVEEAERDTGFTIIELLVSIVVIGILAGTVSLAASGLRTRAQDTSCDQELRNIETALVLAEADGITAPDTGDLVGPYLAEEPSWHGVNAGVAAANTGGPCA